MAPQGTDPARLARITATPLGRQFATPRTRRSDVGWQHRHRLARITAAPSRVAFATPRPVPLIEVPSYPRHGSLAGVTMPPHRQRYRCASRRADGPTGHRTGTARPHHGDPFRVASSLRFARRLTAQHPPPFRRPLTIDPGPADRRSHERPDRPSRVEGRGLGNCEFNREPQPCRSHSASASERKRT